MADQNITALPVATTPESSDQLLLVGTTEEKLIDYDKLADAILGKIASKNFALDQGNKTLLAALNELNSNRALMYLYSTSSDNNTYLKYKVGGRCTVLVVANDSDGKTLCFIVGVNAFETCSISWLTNPNSNVKATYENKIITISGITTWFSSTIISTHDIEIIK